MPVTIADPDAHATKESASNEIINFFRPESFTVLILMASNAADNRRQTVARRRSDTVWRPS